MIELYAFDVDGTLVASYMDAPEPSAAFRYVEVLPGRRKRLQEILASGARIALITNQAGVAFGYQTLEETRDKLHRVQQALSLDRRTSMHIAFGHPKSTDPRWNTETQIQRRKPHPEMLLEAMAGWRVRPDKTIYVGDMDSDREFARNAGVHYLDADEFFTRD